MNTYDGMRKALKCCDLSENNCGECPYNSKHPNECMKELHRVAYHLLQDAVEQVQFFAQTGGNPTK